MVTEFERVLQAHAARYPLMEPQDYGKLAYQNHFGAEHLVSDEGQMLRRIREEWDSLTADLPIRGPENIGGGLCRFYLNHDVEKDIAAQMLVKLFCMTAKEAKNPPDEFQEKLLMLENLSVPGMREWLEEYRGRGCPPVRHSEKYRSAYHPHYRLLKLEYAAVFPALLETAKVLKEKGRAVVAIDGRCGSGKSSLARLMEQVFSCNVFHMDDFYLPVGQRAENWLEIPGGNMDLARFRREVLDSVFGGQAVDYRAFDCGAGAYMAPVRVEFTPLTVIEGSYSHHPALQAEYDLKLFVTCDKQEQLRRLKEREEDYFPTFERLWMPLEEQYIRLCGIEDNNVLTVDTGETFEF